MIIYIHQKIIYGVFSILLDILQKSALLQAEDSKKQAEEVYQKVLSEAKKAANAQKQAETLIGRYQQEIPEQKKCVEDRKTSYTEVMEIKQMTESEWKELVEMYSREAAQNSA